MQATAVLIIQASMVCALAADSIPFELHGQGWTDFGRVMNVSQGLSAYDGSTIDVEDNWQQGAGVQLTAKADLCGYCEAAFGFGVYQVNHSIGKSSSLNNQPSFLSVSLYKNFITEARLTLFQGDKAAPDFSLTLGNFAYKYNSDVKNLGLYLLRGPVYPGYLMGGFQDFSADSTKSNVMGLRLHHKFGVFSHDLILMNERDLPPTFDWSLAYVAKARPVQAFEVGAGVNFYRAIPYMSKLETPGHLSADGGKSIDNQFPKLDAGGNPVVDANGNAVLDTARFVYLTHQGIKLMGMFNLDLKPLFGIGSLGPDDLKLYGEAAVLGVKNYGTFFNKISRRIPVMGGFNLPVFHLVDFLSVEAEWYGSRYRNDLQNLGNFNSVAPWTQINRPSPSPAPYVGATPYADSTRDNWKWSVNIQKTVHERIQFIGQIANDHYRPLPIATGLIASTGGTAEAFTAPSNWYFMCRVGYAF